SSAPSSTALSAARICSSASRPRKYGRQLTAVGLGSDLLSTSTGKCLYNQTESLRRRRTARSNAVNSYQVPEGRKIEPDFDAGRVDHFDSAGSELGMGSSRKSERQI